jgi:hypothetical protein
MLKQIIALIAFSIAIVLAMSYAQQAVQLLVSAHGWVAQILTQLFSEGQAGNLARGLLALLALPVLIGLVPTIIYWMLRRHWFPYFMEIVWVVWLIQAGALITMSQSA